MGTGKHWILILGALLAFTLTLPAANKRFTLVIDAGHGGHDAGARGAISNEKDINLRVALAFGRNVERNCPDVRVIYTRKTDVFIPLKERADIANRNDADLFISVHTNALPDGKIARGFETYTLGMHRAKDNLDVAMRENSVISMEKGYQQTYQGFDPNSSESYIMFEFIQDKNMAKSVDLAKMIQRSVCQRTGCPDKGVHQAGFLVLRETSMPSCLIELGFITTPDEEQALNDSGRVASIAEAVYRAFLDYKNKYDSRIVVPYRTEEKEEADLPQVVPPTYQDTGSGPVRNQVREKSRKPVQTVVADRKKAEDDEPVFKVQILVSSRELHKGDTHLKGIDDFSVLQEGEWYKYMCGNSSNYNEIYRLRKSLLEKFPQAFIVAFKNGRKMNVNVAIREFLEHRKK